MPDCDGLTVDVECRGTRWLLGVSPQRSLERLLGLCQDHPVLRPLRTCDGGDHGGKVQLEVFGVDRLVVGVVPEALRLGVRLDECDLLLGAPGEAQVTQRLIIDREDRHGGAIFRAHVADRGAVGQRHRRDAAAVELDELPDHTVLAKHLGDGQHQVSGSRSVGEFAGQFEAHDARNQHRHGLPEHGRLGFDAAYAPAQHAQPVHHGGV